MAFAPNSNPYAPASAIPPRLSLFVVLAVTKSRNTTGGYSDQDRM